MSHANDQGCYTIFQNCDTGNSDNDEYNLRGIMVTDENGNYSFESILPGYPEDQDIFIIK